MVTTTKTFKHPVAISDCFYHEISLLTNGNVAIVHGGNANDKLGISIIDPSGTLVSTSDL